MVSRRSFFSGFLANNHGSFSEKYLLAYQTIRHELEQYGHHLNHKPEIVGLNKCDALLPEEIEQKIVALREICPHPILPMSAVAKSGITECLRLLYQIIKPSEEDIDSIND